MSSNVKARIGVGLVLTALAAMVVPFGSGAKASEEFTPLTMRVMSPPSWYTASDGRAHLVYELELTNAIPVPVTVTEVQVLDASTHRAVQTLDGDSLTASMSLLPTGATPETMLQPATIGVVWLDVPFDDPSDIPRRVEHDVTATVPPGLPVPETISNTDGTATVDRRPPIVIGPPLEGPRWLALGSCCDGPHRRSVQPINGRLWLGQRYAIDFNRLSETDLLATGDPSLNESWPTYDQPVLAVADATVIAAADTFADQIPDAPKPVTIEEADGNHVILALGGGRYAFYAHLEPGSVAVRPGDRVERGEIIARTGNSGSSTGPHLHFHVMNRPSALMSNGLPYVFDRFTVTGKAPPLDQIVALNPTTDPVTIDTATAGPRRDELPEGSDLVEFRTVS